jgi:hypothetical protein
MTEPIVDTETPAEFCAWLVSLNALSNGQERATTNLSAIISRADMALRAASGSSDLDREPPSTAGLAEAIKQAVDAWQDHRWPGFVVHHESPQMEFHEFVAERLASLLTPDLDRATAQAVEMLTQQTVLGLSHISETGVKQLIAALRTTPRMDGELALTANQPAEGGA